MPILGEKIYYYCGRASMEVYDVLTGKTDASVPDCPLAGKMMSLIAIPPRENERI
jgi:hypothetical protein